MITVASVFSGEVLTQKGYCLTIHGVEYSSTKDLKEYTWLGFISTIFPSKLGDLMQELYSYFVKIPEGEKELVDLVKHHVEDYISVQRIIVYASRAYMKIYNQPLFSVELFDLFVYTKYQHGENSMI